MTRRILLFVLSFLVSVGVFGLLFGIVHLTKNRADKAPQEQPLPVQPPPEEPTPVRADEVVPPPVTDALPPAPQQNEPSAAEEAAQADKTDENADPALSEQPRTPEHGAALKVEAALKAADPTAALQKLVESGKLSPETAAVLLAWSQAHRVQGIENVGTSRREDGSKVSRWRIKSADGGEDVIIDVVTSRNGEVRVESAATTSSDKTRLSAVSDSLTVAEGFVESVRRGDMATARGMISGAEVSDATVAGLCMIFEEGEFSLRQDAPIRNTFENAAHAGYLVYLVSQGSDKPCNFGLELSKEDMWKVTGVALDSLLANYEDSGNAEGGHFFPIVKNPKGGDSLALFFGFNEAVLTPRSMRQLQIVAELLKQSKGKLNISGHTDDVGSDQYNVKLSEQRAFAVKEALVSFGVDASQITTRGLGKSEPRRVYKADDTEQQINYIRSENRRAEIYLDFES